MIYELCFRMLAWFVAGLIFLFCVLLLVFSMVLIVYIIKELREEMKNGTINK